MANLESGGALQKSRKRREKEKGKQENLGYGQNRKRPKPEKGGLKLHRTNEDSSPRKGNAEGV